MSKILLQTTIVDIPDDWNVGRFSLLADELRRAGHDVTARNRRRGDDDPVLSARRARLRPALADGRRHRRRPRPTTRGSCASASGGGVLTARDHQDLGSCLLRSVDRPVNHFHNQNPDPSRVVTTRTTRTSRGPTTTRAPTATTSRCLPTSRRTSCCAPTADRQRPHRVVPGPPPRGRGVGAAGPFATVLARAEAPSAAGGSTSRCALDGETTADGRPWAGPCVLDLPPLRRHELGHRPRRAVVRHRAARGRDEA